MFYPDLRSLADVETLPLPEFRLRVECLTDRIRWERGGSLDPPAQNVKRKLSKAELMQKLAALPKREGEQH